MNFENKMIHSHECKCFSWQPVFVGALAVIGLSFLLNLFSVAIGLTAFTATSDGTESLALGGLIGWAIGIIVSMFASGWLAGYLGNRHCSKRHIGALYGFLTWCVALVVSVMLASHMNRYVMFYSHFISGNSINMGNLPQMNDINKTISDQPANSLVISTYVIFILFFLSAFACSLGGHFGMCHRCKDTINQ